MKQIYLLLNLAFAVQICAAQRGSEPIKVTDMLKIQQISSLTISPDKKRVAFVVNNIEQDGENKWEYKYLNQVYIAPFDRSAAPKPLTFKENASQPAWSPDGKQLAFVRSVDNKPQIFLLSFDGGEPMQLTKFKYGASSPKWSPDGKQLLFAASIPLRDMIKDAELNPKHELPKWPLEKPGFDKNTHLNASAALPNPDGTIDEIRAYLDNNVADKKAKVINKLNFQEEAATSGDLSFNHFFIMNAEAGAKPAAVTHGFYRFGSAEFMPDGQKLLLTGDIDSTEHPDRSLESEIFITDVNGKNLKQILGKKGMSYNSAKISPSGKWIAFQYGGTGFVDIPTLAIMPVNGSEKDMITFSIDRNKNNINWSEDEQFLYFNCPSNGGAPILRLNVKTKNIDSITVISSGTNVYDVRGDRMAYVKTMTHNPYALWVQDLNTHFETELGHFNSWIDNKKLSFPEERWFVNEKGLKVQYWIMKPANYVAGKKYPAILNIHGGPTAMWGPGETSMWHEFQYYCAQGYVVVYGNPRGSGGYGAEFLKANVNDWGAGPTSDVLTYLDKAIAEGFIDSSKLAVTGGSYAGYLVAWIIGHDQRFKAASSQRGVYDLGTFFGEGNAWRLVPNYFGGYPWEPTTRANILRESPINYVQNIYTPYLIFHGENDLRTGVIQGEMLYKSLKVLGRPVEYVRHPGGTHELTRSGNNRQRIDQMLRTIEFFNRFIRH